MSPKYFKRKFGLRFLNGGVLRNLNIYSFQKLYPVCSATWLRDVVQYEVCWPMGSASTGRAPQQLTESPFKYLKTKAPPHIFIYYFSFCLVHGDQFLYAIGGFQKAKDSILDVVERYNRERNQWTKIANLPMRLMYVIYLGFYFVLESWNGSCKKMNTIAHLPY